MGPSYRMDSQGPQLIFKAHAEKIQFGPTLRGGGVQLVDQQFFVALYATTNVKTIFYESVDYFSRIQFVKRGFNLMSGLPFFCNLVIFSENFKNLSSTLKFEKNKLFLFKSSKKTKLS